MPVPELNPAEVARYFAVRVPSLSQKGKQWRGACPVHGGERDSFSVDSNTGRCFCHSSCGIGWDVFSLEVALGGKDFKAALADVNVIVGRPEKTKQPSRRLGPEVAVYDYVDEHGEVRYQVVRHKDPKDFTQRRPNPNGGDPIRNLEGVEPLPYRLPQLIPASYAMITEGERDADALAALGTVATCNSGGAGNFGPELVKWFAGKRICILPDNDEPGLKHAHKVAALLHPVARSVRIVEIPDLPEKGDVSDYLEAGGTLEGLRELYAKTPDYNPVTTINPEDNHVRTIRQQLVISGGVQGFWDMSLNDGIPTPFEDLTEALNGGFLRGEVYVLGGETGSGKTSLGLQMAVKALRAKIGVLIFSLEMDWLSVMRRMISAEARVDLNLYRRMCKDGAAKGMRFRLAELTSEFQDFPLYVSRKPVVTPKYIVEATLRYKEKCLREYGVELGLVIVDHMQLMSFDEKKAAEYEKFTAISRGVKQTATEADAALLLMSQVSRSKSKERRTELEISDFRGSGAIEEDTAGAMVIFPDKEDLDAAVHDNNRQLKGPIKTWLKLPKNRYGQSGLYVPLNHFKAFTRFDLYRDDWRSYYDDTPQPYVVGRDD
jgi:KaiC/GvpD/RAD55 family RecA-like ATPase